MQKLNFAAPELFSLCDECGQYGCNGHCEDHDCSFPPGKKTMQTDVYAFGCLYYAVSMALYLPRLMMTGTLEDILRYRTFSKKK
jgi:hypothetical protein